MQLHWEHNVGFSQTETLNLDRKIAAGVIDANESGQWYDSQIANIPAILNKDVLTQFGEVPPANNRAAAQANAVAKPAIIQDYSDPANAVRLTVVSGTNGSTFLATSVQGVYSEDVRLCNWIHPTRIPLSSGLPSIGYTVKVYQGNPATGGTEILTTTGLGGAGETASPAWIFNYDQGILLISADFRTTLTNPYILGFRYIGDTLDETITNLGGSYTPPVGSHYIDTATGLNSADLLLDAAIYNEVTNRTAGDVTLQSEIDALQDAIARSESVV